MNLLSNPRYTKTVTVTRASQGSWVAGEFVAGGGSSFEMVANVQPIGDRDLVQEFGGRRDKEMLKVYCREALNPTNAGASTEADRITIGGQTYEVVEVNPWRNHYKAIVAKVNL